ncbi:MAG TPA: 2Fe-2S iron-sulfur cluster-binding protein [Candidatus Acidoferrum sp.]|nr:2Fe-2S iron-sulfur cluster-binding protein [Candidatus Acidoferrum sp.]
MPRVTFLPSGITADCQDGENILELGRRHEVPIETACVGRATCGLCRVRVVAGAEFLTPFNKEEEKHLGNVYFLTRVRLACQSVVRGGDVTVELAPRRAKKQS